jgi:hypothetical protein
MRDKALHVLIAWAIFLMPRLVAAQGNLVVNGSFTSGGGGAWTVTNAPGFAFAFEGNPGHCAPLDNPTPSDSTDPTISQTVHGLTPGVVYAVSGQYRFGKDRGGGSPADPNFGVAIDGLFLFETLVPHDAVWRDFVFLHTATSPSVVLSLSAQRNYTGVSCFVDNVALQPFPSLAANVVGQNIVVKWHTNVAGFVLQSSTDLPSTLGWQNVTNSLIVAGSNYTVTLSATNPTRFFRLKL